MECNSQKFSSSTSVFAQKSADVKAEVKNNSNCQGIGWISFPHLDSKCYKLVKRLSSQKEAEKICADQNQDQEKSLTHPLLVSIKSATEEEALTNFFFRDSKNQTSKLKQNVWLGAQRSTANYSLFLWADGSPMERYFNWDAGSPTENTTRGCVQMQSGFEPSTSSNQSTGKWRDVSCGLANSYVLCEKPQTWTPQKMQAEILKVKHLQELMIEQLALPLGFIYVQLPGQSLPAQLWPQYRWTDVSLSYHSTFFRVAGSRAAKFGTVQRQSAPFIDGAQYRNCREGAAFVNNTDSCSKFNYTWKAKFGSRDNGWSENVVSSHQYNSGNEKQPMWIGTMSFSRKAMEVRPENMAVKVWKRTG